MIVLNVHTHTLTPSHTPHPHTSGQERRGPNLHQHSSETDWDTFSHCGVCVHQERDPLYPHQRVSGPSYQGKNGGR